MFFKFSTGVFSMKIKFESDFFVVLGGIAVTLLLATDLRADVRLPEIFASDMILQQEMNIPVWGSGFKLSV
jgi:hypothetical protein